MPITAPVERPFFSTGAGNGCDTGAETGTPAAEHPGGDGFLPSAKESALAVDGSYLLVPIGTGKSGLSAFHATLKSCTAVLTGLPGCETDTQ
jgi:hypothetical protein